MPPSDPRLGRERAGAALRWLWKLDEARDVGELFPLIEAKGLSAAIYTQTTDVEIEVNGLMTYDRELVKMDWKKIAAANRRQKSGFGANLIFFHSQDCRVEAHCIARDRSPLR